MGDAKTALLHPSTASKHGGASDRLIPGRPLFGRRVEAMCLVRDPFRRNRILLSWVRCLKAVACVRARACRLASSATLQLAPFGEKSAGHWNRRWFPLFSLPSLLHTPLEMGQRDPRCDNGGQLETLVVSQVS